MANYTATLTVQNVGAGPTTADRTITITLPTGWSYGSNTGGYTGNQSGQSLTLTKAGVLAAGASEAFAVVLAVATAAVDGAATLAFAVATTGDSSSANNTATLAPVVSHPAPAATYSSTLLALAPVLYWRLGEASGTVAADSSGNARPGVINGTVGYAQTSLIANNGGDGAMRMDAGGKVTRANGSALVTGGSMSQVVWATVLSSPSGNVQFGGFRTFGGNEFYITQVGGGQTVEARFTNSAGTQFTFSPTVGVGTHMFALVFNAATNRLDFSIDGVAQTQLVTTGGYASATEGLAVGDSKGEFIDEYALFNVALTAAQVQSLYDAGKAPAIPFTAAPTWSDEFTNTALSYATDSGGGTWRTKGYEFGGTLADGFKDAAGSNWNISPTQNPADNPFSVANSVLTISAKRLTTAVQASVTAANAQNVEWQGGYLVSNHLAGDRGTPLTWRYGYFEFRARFPNPARGMFPALWFFNNDATANGTGHESAEIDLLEIFGNPSGQPWASGYHNKPNSVEGNVGYWTGDDTAGWHRYGMEWTATAIRYYRDGALKGELTGTPATWFQNTNLGIRINYAIDPNYLPPQTDPNRTTTSDPALGYVYQMDVDYVRVYSSLPSGLPTGSAAPPLNSGAAMYPATTTSLASIAQPVVARPAYLSPITDPTFGTKVTRVGDQTAFGTSSLYPKTQYAKIQSWNSDGTKLLINYEITGFVAQMLDGNTYARIGNFTPGAGQVRFSNTQPNVGYGRSGADFRQVNMTTGAATTLRTFPASIDIGNGEGNVDNADTWVMLIGSDNKVYPYNIQTNVIGTPLQLAANPNNVCISQDGLWVAIQWTGLGSAYSGSNVTGYTGTKGIDIYGHNNGVLTYVRKYAGQYTGHYDWGVDTAGNQVVALCNFSDFLGPQNEDLVVLQASTQNVYAVTPRSTGDQHVSCRNLNRPGWAYISAPQYWDGLHEQYAVKLLSPAEAAANAAKTFNRFCHSHEVNISTYEYQPWGAPNRDGSRVIFNSSWDLGAGNPVYPYVVQMP